MMADDRDSLLQTLFTEAQHDLVDEAFTSRVMARTRGRTYRVVFAWFSVALVLAASAWLLALPLQEFAQLITQGLTISLFDLGDSWLAWFLAPINNVASLLILSVKVIRIVRKKFRSAYFAY